MHFRRFFRIIGLNGAMMHDMVTTFAHALFGDGERTNCGRGCSFSVFYATSLLYDAWPGKSRKKRAVGNGTLLSKADGIFENKVQRICSMQRKEFAA